MRADILPNVQNKNGVSHFRIGTHYCNLPEIDEEIFRQLNRNLPSRADISEEIFEDYWRHINENLRMKFPEFSLVHFRRRRW